MGSLLFGIHVAIVNGPLTQIALDLGFAGSTSLKGLVRPHCHADNYCSQREHS